MGEQLQAIVTVLSLVNPVICAAMFSSAETGRSTSGKVADGIKASAAVLVILSLAALFGAKTLETFGISLDAFKVAGGGVLGWMGFSILSGGTDPRGSGRGVCHTTLTIASTLLAKQSAALVQPVRFPALPPVSTFATTATSGECCPDCIACVDKPRCGIADEFAVNADSSERSRDRNDELSHSRAADDTPDPVH